MTKQLLELFEEKARKGDGSFAIAYATMQLAYANEHVATMVGRLGFDCPDHPGAFEGIGIELQNIRKALEPLIISANIGGEIETSERRDV